MNLRHRQIKAVEDVTAAYRAGYRAPVMIAPTGFGKTHTSVTIIRRALDKGKRVWFLAHLKEILNATSEKLFAEGIQHGWIAAGRIVDRRQAVQVCMVQTLVRRLDRYAPPDLMIVDEAHLTVAQTYQSIFEWAKAGPKYGRPGGAHLLHLTATPQRLDGRGMGEVADILIPTCTTGELIEEGLLSPIRYFAPSAPDLQAVRKVAGESFPSSTPSMWPPSSVLPGIAPLPSRVSPMPSSVMQRCAMCRLAGWTWCATARCGWPASMRQRCRASSCCRPPIR